MTDYSALDNRALDMEIARRLGWEGIHETSYWEEDYYDTRKVTALEGRRDGDERLLPHWSEDANAALELFVDSENWILHYTITIGFVSRREGGQQAVADTPARAICLAWLAWKDATDGT